MPAQELTSVQLDIYVRVEPDRLLVESFGGFGPTRDAAIADAFARFTGLSLHVLLAAFYHERDDWVRTEHWQINGQSRRVTIGPMGTRGTLPNPPPVEMLLDLEDMIKASALPSGAHWVRCYYEQILDHAGAVEVLLDNEDWAAVLSEVTVLKWPQSENSYSVRVFLIVQDEEE